jgi:Asparagine synthase
MSAAPLDLSRLELATGLLFGASPRPVRLPDAGGCLPRRALEREILPCLRRPPCLVSFSGGRDSSAILAVAATLARREGLPLPIPATNVIATAEEADESEWQHRVIAHLGLDEWLRIKSTDELDVIGPYAQRVLRTHGVLWPCNIHFHLPLLDAARGGSLLTGIGGDELFAAARRSRMAALRARAVRPEPRDGIRIALAFAPQALRRAVIARREPVAFPWLRHQARRAATADGAVETAAEPRALRDRLAWWQTLRYLRVAASGIELVARGEDVRIAHPLLSRGFWAAVAGAAGPDGFGGRTDGMRRLFGDLLPDEIIERRSKANFDEAFWTDRARSFAAVWDGGGVPNELVDVAALQAHWRGPRPLAQSFILLQAAWLASTLRALDTVEQPPQSIVGRVPATPPSQLEERQ